ncbi:gamma-glutamylcyclotransferase, partial [Euryarchaeota archaeon]|nr:gamma-glutamylcyclotransferase [Euryarchaeota archaeon]
MERLPFFVYGTLIPDQPNYYLWKDSIADTKNGIIKNYQLFDMGHYPMILQSEGNNVHGMLMYVNDEDYEKITKIIDNLEGYNPENHGNSAYNREMRDIELKNGESEKAWIYIGSKEYVKEENGVKNG